MAKDFEVTYRLDCYNILNNKYETNITVDEQTSVEVSIVQHRFPDPDEFTLKFGDIYMFEHLVPKSALEMEHMQPLIIHRYHGTELIWTTFIIKREYFDSPDGQYVIFTGSDIKHFLKNKINVGNKNETKYIKNGTMGDIIYDIFNINFINPVEYAYGVKPTVPAPYRKFKGLGQVYIDIPQTNIETVTVKQNQIHEHFLEMFILFNQEVVFRQRFNNSTKLIDIYVLPINDYDGVLIDSDEDVTGLQYGVVDTQNTIFANANIGVFYTAKKIDGVDFTSSEQFGDYSFIAGNDINLLIPPAETELVDERRGKQIYILSIQPKQDILHVDCTQYTTVLGKKYIINAVEFTETADSRAFNIDLLLI